MAKKSGKSGGQKPPGECPEWVLNLDANQLRRLEALRRVVEDNDVCEMPPRVQHLRSGEKQALYLVGDVENGPVPGKKR